MNKIVRTKLGIEPERLTEVHTNSEEGLKYLKRKLVEEAQEVLDTENPKELAEELGDVLQVLEEFYNVGFFTDHYITTQKITKYMKKGRFSYFSPYTSEYIFLVLGKEND